MMVCELAQQNSGGYKVKRTYALAAAVLSLAAVSAFAADSKLTGYISDSMCAAKHMGTGAACAKK